MLKVVIVSIKDDNEKENVFIFLKKVLLFEVKVLEEITVFVNSLTITYSIVNEIKDIDEKVSFLIFIVGKNSNNVILEKNLILY